MPDQGKKTRASTARGVQSSAAVEAAYRRRLLILVDEMGRSLLHWLRATYRASPPAIAQDEMLSSAALRVEIAKLRRRWLRRFDKASDDLASYFAAEAGKRSDEVLRRILKEGGYAVKFEPTRAQRDVMGAIVQGNVALIKSIPSQYLDKVEGAVMRSVAAGRDLKSLTDDLQKEFGITRRRAAFIAKDQNSKTTADLTKVRQLESGIKEGIWCHSGGGNHPRPTHVQAGRDKVRFRLDEGWLDPALGKKILPGTEPGCKCFWKPVIPGLDDRG